MDDYERRIQQEIDRLNGPDFPTGRQARQQRYATIRALAEATVSGRSWTGENGVMGSNRPAMVISERNFYGRPHWHPHPMVREAIRTVENILRERDAAELERSRREKRLWLEGKEFEAAESMFDKAADLLSLPYITKKTKSGPGQQEGPVIIHDSANAAVFNAAVNLNQSASNMGRRALGLPVDVKRAELSGVDGGPITYRNDDMSEVSDDELRRRIDALARGALVAIGTHDDAGELANTAGVFADDNTEGEGEGGGDS